MSEFLERILQTKQHEVEALRRVEGLSRPRTRSGASRFAQSLCQGNRLSMIAEVKKASPSKGLIQPNFNPIAIATQYEQLGAAAISVLTDETYFQGSIEDLQSVAEHVNIPVLRKDFVIDEVQIHQAVDAGAEAILLICAALSPARLKQLSTYATDAGLDVLIEVHHVRELDAALNATPSVLGVNNRDLKTFEVNLDTTEIVMNEVGGELPVISESGISSGEDAQRMAATGVRGLLVGESLMRQAGSERELQDLFNRFRAIRQSRETEPSRRKHDVH